MYLILEIYFKYNRGNKSVQKEKFVYSIHGTSPKTKCIC